MNSTQHLKDLALSDTGFVFDPYSGATFTVNASGLCILQGLREGLSRGDVRERMLQRFDVLSQDLERDISDFIQLLRQHELLPADFAF